MSKESEKQRTSEQDRTKEAPNTERETQQLSEEELRKGVDSFQAETTTLSHDSSPDHVLRTLRHIDTAAVLAPHEQQELLNIQSRAEQLARMSAHLTDGTFDTSSNRREIRLTLSDDASARARDERLLRRIRAVEIRDAAVDRYPKVKDILLDKPELTAEEDIVVTQKMTESARSMLADGHLTLEDMMQRLRIEREVLERAIVLDRGNKEDSVKEDRRQVGGLEDGAREHVRGQEKIDKKDRMRSFMETVIPAISLVSTLSVAPMERAHAGVRGVVQAREPGDLPTEEIHEILPPSRESRNIIQEISDDGSYAKFDSETNEKVEEQYTIKMNGKDALYTVVYAESFIPAREVFECKNEDGSRVERTIERQHKRFSDGSGGIVEIISDANGRCVQRYEERPMSDVDRGRCRRETLERFTYGEDGSRLSEERIDTTLSEMRGYERERIKISYDESNRVAIRESEMQEGNGFGSSVTRYEYDDRGRKIYEHTEAIPDTFYRSTIQQTTETHYSITYDGETDRVASVRGRFEQYRKRNKDWKTGSREVSVDYQYAENGNCIRYIEKSISFDQNDKPVDRYTIDTEHGYTYAENGDCIGDVERSTRFDQEGRVLRSTITTGESLGEGRVRIMKEFRDKDGKTTGYVERLFFPDPNGRMEVRKYDANMNLIQEQEKEEADED